MAVSTGIQIVLTIMSIFCFCGVVGDKEESMRKNLKHILITCILAIVALQVLNKF